MTTRREWLVERGLATKGRGRLSAAAHAAIEEAVAAGHVFSDMPKGDSAPSTSKEVKTGAQPAYFGPSPEPFFNGGWKIIYQGNTIPMSGRNVCIKCGCSLDYHRCENPTGLNPRGEVVPVFR